MYRALGIPARVADGYLLSAKAGEFVPVAGVNAHAWVEVYQDGLGWLPVEVTGQNSADAFAELEPEALNEEGSGDDAVDEASGTQPVPMPQEAPAMPVGILQGPDESTTVRPFPWKAVILGSVPVLLALLLLGWIW